MKYKYIINFKVGDKKLNSFLNNMDLGLEGVFLPERISFTSKTIWSKELFNKTKKGLEDIYSKSGKEVREFELQKIEYLNY